MSAEQLPADKLIGQVLSNRYRIELRLGEGAMGSVYKAHHIKVGRPFAVKLLHPRLLEDDKVLLRFEREAELAGRLRHPNVIGVVDVGETPEGLHFMVMDFAEGPDMSALLGEAPMPPQRIIHLVRQMLEGLFHAHSAGLIHRDFKPENVIVEKDTHGSEVPRIVDFGIAILREGGDSNGGPGRLTTNGLVLGTPHYMAPEQAVNDPIDHRIDLFALGIMIYEMLSGKLPFDGNGAEVARANLMLDPPPISVRVPYLEVDPLLEAYARRLMAKSRDARPPTAKVARELLDLIERDREAAAAALGVPLAITRSPRTTEPVAPRGAISDDHPGTFPPPIRDAIATPPQAPPMAGAVAKISRENAIHTEPAAALDSVGLTTAPRTNKKLVLASVAFGTAALLGVVGVALWRHDRVEPAPIARAEPPPVPVVPVVPTPTPTVTPVPTPTAPEPVVSDVGSAAPTPTPIAPTRPATVKHIVKTPTPIVTSPPPVVAVQPAPADTKLEAGPYDAHAFLGQLAAVGTELKAFAQSHTTDISDLQAAYTRIEVNEALKSQATRDSARRSLDQIHTALAHRQ